MRRYDIILFENFHLASNHKFDMYQMARMLQSRGRSVAILDIYGEETENFVNGVEVVRLPFRPIVPDDRWMKRSKTNVLVSALYYMRFFWQQHFYLKSVVKTVKDWSDCFYCGSYNINMSTAFLKSGKTCVYWGLRSYWMSGFWYFLLHRNPLLAARLLYVRYAFLNCSNAKLMVSNDIIKSEFERIGIESGRLFVREERIIQTKMVIPASYHGKEIVFLTIGMLREEKQIVKTIDAFKRANIPNSRLMLIGKSVKDYENTIIDAISGDSRIFRRNEFLEYDDFNSYIKDASYVVFADKKGLSCVTNGTMNESLINYRPIIAPNYEPYSYYVNKYNVGLLYDIEDLESFACALRNAASTDPSIYQKDIDSYLDSLLENVVAESVDIGIFGL